MNLETAKSDSGVFKSISDTQPISVAEIFEVYKTLNIETEEKRKAMTEKITCPEEHEPALQPFNTYFLNK